MTKIHATMNQGCAAACNERTDRMDELLPFQEALFHIGDTALIADASGVIRYVNDVFSSVTGYTFDEAVGRRPSLLKSGQHDALFYSNLWMTITQGRCFRGVFVNRRKDGSIFHEEKSVSPVRSLSGEITHFISIGRDVSDQIVSDRYSQRLSHHDSLTYLLSRNAFLELLDNAHLRSIRLGLEIGVVLLEVLNLKDVNDTLGYEIGDDALRKLADRFRNLSQKNMLIARWSGDKFALLIEGETIRTSMESVARRMLDGLSAPLCVSQHHLLLTGCSGLVVCPDDADHPTDLVKHANFSLNRAKKEGPGSIVQYSKSIRDSTQTSFFFENALYSAQQQKEFYLEFQPIVKSGVRNLVAIETLLRWKSATHGIIGPDKFIPILEHSGLIVSVGRWVLCTACGVASTLATQRGIDFRIAVNVSARQLLHPEFYSDVLTAIREANLAPNYLELEITETVLIENSDAAREILRRLREKGIRIAIDDFGTGYSSLSYLRRFPVDTIKIDRSFVRAMDEDPDAIIIVRAIINLARELGLEVVSEGVETDDQEKLLNTLGSNYQQGYWFSKPVSMVQLQRWFDNSGLLACPV